jgi:transcription elongation GreA/GreB family factor
MLESHVISLIDKNKIIAAVTEKIQADINLLRAAIHNSHTAATHEETQAKSKYDTFALESSYLANGQTKKLAELDAALAYFKSIQSPLNPKTVSLNCLVKLSKQNQASSTVFLAKFGGGIQVQVDTNTVIVVTESSPIGQNLLGAGVGDVFEIKSKDLNAEYEVLEFC